MSVKEFQQKRIDAFDEIDDQLKFIRLLLVKAKNETIDYYNQNPNSYGVDTPTCFIKGLLDDIEDLLMI
jgi:hypothetical protein